MIVDVLENFPSIHSELSVVALSHHLEARLNEGSPGKVLRGVRHAREKLRRVLESFMSK